MIHFLLLFIIYWFCLLFVIILSQVSQIKILLIDLFLSLEAILIAYLKKGFASKISLNSAI